MTQTTPEPIEGQPIFPETYDIDLEAATASESSSPRLDYSILNAPTLPKKLPEWYSPGYHSYANVRKSRMRLSNMGYGPHFGPDYNRNTVEKNHRWQFERRVQEGSVNADIITERLKGLADQYPMMSPDMLLGVAMSGGVGGEVDPALAALDEQGVTNLLAQNIDHTTGSPVGIGTGVRFDRTTEGTVTLPSGTVVKVGKGDVVIRDGQGQVVNLIPTNAPGEGENAEQGWTETGAAGWSIRQLQNAAKTFLYTLSMPYEGLVGASRNVGRTLSDGGDAGDVLADIFGYIPMVAAIREMIEGDDYINPWEQTYMGQMMLAAARGERIDVGTGWFINEESDIFNRQLEAAAGAYTINEQAFTFGRGLAGALVEDPNSLAYRQWSGVVDFTSAVLLDPTVWAAGLGLPSKVAKFATTAPVISKPTTAAVRGSRKAVGMEPGTGVLSFGKTKRQAAMAAGRLARNVEELPKAEARLKGLKDDWARAADDLDRRAAIEEQIDETQETIGRISVENENLARQADVARLLDEVEEASTGRVSAQVEKERQGNLGMVGRTSARLKNNADESREVNGRLAREGTLADDTTALSAKIGYGVASVGDTVSRNGKPWTVVEAGDRVALKSEKGARRYYTAEEFAEQFGSQGREVPIHSWEQLRTAMLDYVQKKPGDLRDYEIQAVEALRTLPGDVTVGDLTDVDNMRFTVGALDGEDMVAAWVGDVEPQLLSAASEVPESVVKRLFDRLSEEVLAPESAQVKKLKAEARRSGISDGEMTEALVKSWVESETLGDDVMAMLSPNAGPVTWGDLLEGLNRVGLATYVERVIREDGFDGIAGLISKDAANLDGVWWGYNGNMASYRARIGRLAEDTDIRVRTEHKVDEEGLALVLDDASQMGKQVDELQDSMVRLQQQRDDLIEKAKNSPDMPHAERAELDRRIQGFDDELRETLEKWQAAKVGFESAPNYTRAARERRAAALKARREALDADRERLHGASQKQAAGLSATAQRMNRLAQEMSVGEESLESLRIAAGADLDEAGRGAVDLDATNRFLFGGSVEGAMGKAGRYAMRVLSKTTSRSALIDMTKGKINEATIERIMHVTTMNVERARQAAPQALENPAVAARVASGEITSAEATLAGDLYLTGSKADEALDAWKIEEVSRILAENVGTSFRKPLSAGMISNTGANSGFAEEVPGTGPRKYVVEKRQHPWVKRMFDVMPSAVKIDLHSAKSTSMGLNRYLTLAGIEAKSRWKMLDELWDDADLSGVGQAGRSRNVTVKVMNTINDHLADRIDELGVDDNVKSVLKEKMRSATRVWAAGERDAAIYWRENLGDVNAPIKLRLNNGNTMPITGAQIEAEMAHGAIFLPDMQDYQAMITRAGKFASAKLARGKDASPKSAQFVAESLNRFFSDYWRSFMLLRVSYMVRNVMEMQVRNFLTGHMNIFNNPLATAAAVIGPQLDPKSSMAKKFNVYSHDVNGVRFSSRKGLVDDPHQQKIVEREHAEYLEMLRTDRSLVDVRMYTGKASGTKQGAPRTVGQDAGAPFNQAWAEELMLLRASPSVRIVAGNLDEKVKEAIEKNPEMREQIIARYLMKSPDAEEARQILRSGGPEYQTVLNDETAMIDHLFGKVPDENGKLTSVGGNPDNIQRRIDVMTGENDHLREFVATGKVVGNDGLPYRPQGKFREVKQLSGNHKEDVDTLRDLLVAEYKNSDSVTLPKNARLWTMETGRRGIGALDAVLDSFFKVATRVERVGVMGPEWRYAYYDVLGDLVTDMTPKAQKKMWEMFQETGMRIHDQGQPLMRIRKAEKALRKPKASGTLELEDVHRIASDRASEWVQELYYDAHQRQQFWQMSRLAIPFGQAWYDTFATWSKLATKNPIQVYKAQRAFNAAVESGSNVVYETADQVLPTEQSGWFESPEASEEAPWYDSRQGVLYTDAFGEKSFVIPGLGHAMTALGNAPVGGGPGVPMGGLQSAMRLNNLNLLTGGGSPLPGLGPAITLPASAITSRADGGVGEFFYDWMYPVGQPDLGNGIIDLILPTALKRLASALGDRDSHYVMANMPASTHFLMSTGDYDINNVEEQNKLLDDSLSIAKWFGVATAIGQFILPTVPSNVWVGKDVDGRRVGMAAASALYYDGYAKMYDDPTQAQLAFLDDFGEPFLASTLVGGSNDVRYGRIMSSQAWDLVQGHPDMYDHADSIGFLFPGTMNLDFQALSWMNETGAREKLTASEWSVRFQSMMFQTRIEKIRYDEVKQGLPPNEVESRIAAVEAEMAQAGGSEMTFDRGASDIEKAHEFLVNSAPEEIVGSPNAVAFMTMYEARETLVAQADRLGIKSLDAKALAPYRVGYLNGLSQMEQLHPELRPLVRSFRNEVQ